MFSKAIKEYLNDNNIVFKSANKCVIVLQRTDNTKTNEDRDDVTDKRYAKFRGSEFLVIAIIDKFTGEKRNEVSNSFNEKILLYKKGEIIRPDYFYEYIDKICAPGIHYFIDHESAFYYGLDKVDDGEYKRWYENGQLCEQCTYLNGKINGECKSWYDYGQLGKQCTYVNGEKNGEYKSWYYNGQLWEECTYVNGKFDGEYKRWYYNGQLWEECTYVNGELV